MEQRQTMIYDGKPLRLRRQNDNGRLSTATPKFVNEYLRFDIWVNKVENALPKDNKIEVKFNSHNLRSMLANLKAILRSDPGEYKLVSMDHPKDGNNERDLSRVIPTGTMKVVKKANKTYSIIFSKEGIADCEFLFGDKDQYAEETINGVPISESNKSQKDFAMWVNDLEAMVNNVYFDIIKNSKKTLT